jgi:hypothetical protein
MTRDVDLAVSVASDAEAEACVRALMDRGYRVLEVLEHGPSGRLSTVRLLPPAHQGGGVLCDLVFATCGVDLVEAERLIELVSLRGFARGKDLRARFTAYRGELQG